MRLLAQDTGISIATAYRYLHEALDLISHHAPNLIDTLADQVEAGKSYVCLDATLIHPDRMDERSGIGIKTPFKSSNLNARQKVHNTIQAAIRAPAEKANPLLKDLKTLQPITLNPTTITRPPPPPRSTSTQTTHPPYPDKKTSLNRPGMSGDSDRWEGWSHVREHGQALSG